MPPKKKINIEETALSLAVAEITRLRDVVKKNESEIVHLNSVHQEKLNELTQHIKELEDENSKLLSQQAEMKSSDDEKEEQPKLVEKIISVSNNQKRKGLIA